MLHRVKRACSAVAAATLFSLTAVVASSTPASALDVYSGDFIMLQHANGATNQCSLTTVARRGDALYGITAGHCLRGRVTRVLASDGRTPIASNMADSGFVERGKLIGKPVDDIGWFRLDPHVRYAHAMRGGSLTTGLLNVDTPLINAWRSVFPVRPVAGRAPVTAARPGSFICKDGSRTGRTCGFVFNVYPQSGEIVAFLPATSGDSGSPAYIMEPGGKARLVGVLSGVGFGQTVIDSIEPLPVGLY